MCWQSVRGMFSLFYLFHCDCLMLKVEITVTSVFVSCKWKMIVYNSEIFFLGEGRERLKEKGCERWDMSELDSSGKMTSV